MTTPDEAESKALTAAHAISEQVGHLWLSAHAEGMRNGLEVAATLLQSAADEATQWPDVVELIARLRDNIRLCALQVPDPEGA